MPREDVCSFYLSGTDADFSEQFQLPNSMGMLHSGHYLAMKLASLHLGTKDIFALDLPVLSTNCGNSSDDSDDDAWCGNQLDEYSVIMHLQDMDEHTRQKWIDLEIRCIKERLPGNSKLLAMRYYQYAGFCNDRHLEIDFALKSYDMYTVLGGAESVVCEYIRGTLPTMSHLTAFIKRYL